MYYQFIGNCPFSLYFVHEKLSNNDAFKTRKILKYAKYLLL